MLAAAIGRKNAWDHQDGRLMHVIREVLGRRHDPRLLRVALRVGKGEVAGGNEEGHVDGPSLAVGVPF